MPRRYRKYHFGLTPEQWAELEKNGRIWLPLTDDNS